MSQLPTFFRLCRHCSVGGVVLVEVLGVFDHQSINLMARRFLSYLCVDAFISDDVVDADIVFSFYVWAGGEVLLSSYRVVDVDIIYCHCRGRG